MVLDSADRQLLNLIQTEFPFDVNPYAELGRRISASEADVLQRIARLKAEKIIRQIGPVIDSRKLGYKTTLVAAKISDSNLEDAERIIKDHPGVSHGYERNHEFNVWFTLAVPPSTDIENEIERISNETNPEAIFSLPSLKMYKIGAYFDMGEGAQTKPYVRHHNLSDNPIELNAAERSVVNILQQDLPLTSAPFSPMAQQAGLDVEQFLTACRYLNESGIIRRFSASINHRNAGFTANGMTCWQAPLEVKDNLGHKLASLQAVSHCYERRTNELWKYNLFAMIHGRSPDECRETAEKVSEESGLKDYVMLYSTKEFKKARVKYQL